jgi:hypothetical protein
MRTTDAWNHRIDPRNGAAVNAFVFPAGDPDVRFNIAIHRLTYAEPPRRWSVDVNRTKVSAGDIAFLWQSGDDRDLWRPGVWAAGVVYRFDRVLEPHWRDPNEQTMYADLEMKWVPIVDRGTVRDNAEAGGSMRASVLAAQHQRMRSPVNLRDDEADWLLQEIPAWAKRWIRDMQLRVHGPTR